MRSLAILGFTLCFFAAAGIMAHKKLMWTDEFNTYYVAVRPTFGDVWDALCDGPDLSPPLNHWATRYSIALLGDNHLAVRLPALIGFWAMSLFIYRSARLWVTPAIAFVAMLLPISTYAFPFAYEARPYGLLLAFSAGALSFWLTAVRNQHRLASLVGMTLCLCGAMATHWFGILIVGPLVAGEIVRTIALKKCDLPVWCLLGLSLATIALLWPLTANAQNTAQFWQSDVSIMGLLAGIPRAFSVMFAGAAFFFLGCCLICLLASLRGGQSDRQLSPLPPSFELVAVSSLALLPAFGAVFAALKTGVVFPRYVLPAVVGVSLLFGLALQRAFQAQRASSCLVAFALAATACSVLMAKSQLHERSDVDNAVGDFALLGHQDVISSPCLPIAIVDLHTICPLNFYAPPALARQLVFVGGLNPLQDKAALQLAGWGIFRAEPYEDFVKKNNAFYLYEVTSATILPALLARGATIQPALEGADPGRPYHIPPGRLYCVHLEPTSRQP